MLKTVVWDIEELRVEQNVSDQLKVLTGKSQTYEEYFSLIVSSAITYDDNRRPKPLFSRNNNNNSRSIYQHDVSPNNDSWGDHNDFEEFNVNTSIQDIKAYSTQFRQSRNSGNQSTFLPSIIYKDMNEQSRSGWNKIEPEIKEKIVKSMSSPSSVPSPTSNLSPRKGHDNQNISLHNISLHNFIVNYHKLKDQDGHTDVPSAPIDEEPDESSPSETTSEENDKLLIQAVKHSGTTPNKLNISQNGTNEKSKVSPADVKFLLSNNNKRFGNLHEIIYKVSTLDTKESVSLVDRGTKGGITGNDIRII